MKKINIFKGLNLSGFKIHFVHQVFLLRIYVLLSTGCGDCGVQSNCVAIKPLETPLGRKRAIDQSSCNKDYSCVKGFCPSFVTIIGGAPKKAVGVAVEVGGEATEPGMNSSVRTNTGWGELPQPTLPDISTMPWNILICGIGGQYIALSFFKMAPKIMF